MIEIQSKLLQFKNYNKFVIQNQSLMMIKQLKNYHCLFLDYICGLEL